MVINNDEDVMVDTSSLISYCREQRVRRQSHIPDEIWLEILSRLPIKSLFVSRCVCKLWRKLFFVLENKIDTNPMYVPVCGLLLFSFSLTEDRTKKDYFFSYFCLKTKENFNVQYDSPEAKLICSSGFKRGLLSRLSFDFSIIRNITPAELNSIVLHGGLLLERSSDGNFRVHNPATKQVYFLPKSPTVKKYGFANHAFGELPGLIIQFPSRLTEKRCGFIVVMFCIRMRSMEVYCNVTRVWRKYRLRMDDELLSSIRWCLKNYVGFYESGVLCLYVLTTKNCGVAIKFQSCMKQYIFPLPEVVVREGVYNARIWECEESLYLSCYNTTSLWIWKASSTQVDAWAWDPVLEISCARQLCKQVARQHLSKAVLNSGDRVMPLAFHPNVAVVYLMIKSSVFAYNWKMDTLNMVGEIKDHEHRSLDFVYTFKPCLSFIAT